MVVVDDRWLCRHCLRYGGDSRLRIPKPATTPFGLKRAQCWGGRHAGYDVPPWHPAIGYAGYVATPGNREPLGTFVLNHGNAGSAENKLPLADVVVRAGHCAVHVEWPGHASDRVRGP